MLQPKVGKIWIFLTFSVSFILIIIIYYVHYQGQAGDGGEHDNLFPHPWKVQRGRRCGLCLEQVQGDGYTEAVKKLHCKAKQCQQCQTSLCDDHIIIICKKCGNNLIVRPAPADDDALAD